MKKSCLLLLFLCFFVGLRAQKNSSFEVGVKAGLSTTDIDAGELDILDQGGADRLELAVKDARYGFHAGLLFRIRFNKFILQPEVVFNTNRVDYEVDDVNMGNVVTTTLEESYQYIDIPVLAGFKFGPLRLQAGPVGHIYLDSSSEFYDLADIDYRQEFENLTLGWQGNIGLDIWNLLLDFRYEGNFANFGTHLNFAGQQYEFDDTPSRFLVSLSYLF